MAAGKIKYRVLVVSSGDKIRDYFSGLLPADEYELVSHAHNAGEARRLLLSQCADIVIINAPLSDEFGTQLALDLSDSIMGIMLVVKSEHFERITHLVEDSGVLTVARPNSRQSFYGALKLLTAVSARLAKMDRKNRTLQEKMADIRTVNRAKWLLIENLKMSESDAHYYIEKQAMDTRLSRREVAQGIIRTYDK